MKFRKCFPNLKRKTYLTIISLIWLTGPSYFGHKNYFICCIKFIYDHILYGIPQPENKTKPNHFSFLVSVAIFVYFLHYQRLSLPYPLSPEPCFPLPLSHSSSLGYLQPPFINLTSHWFLLLYSLSAQCLLLKLSDFTGRTCHVGLEISSVSAFHASFNVNYLSFAFELNFFF